MNGLKLLTVFAAVVVLGVNAAQASLLVNETFDVDTNDPIADYSHLTFSGTGTFSVSGGRLLVDQDAQTQAIQIAGASGNLVIEGDITTEPGGGSTNVGFQIGGRRYIFHPGYNGATLDGAYRVSGLVDNQDMGYVPSSGPSNLNHMLLRVDAATKQMSVTIWDAQDRTKVFTHTVTDTSYSQGNAMGFTRQSGENGSVAVFDNLTVAQAGWYDAVSASNPLNWYRFNEAGASAIDYGSGGLHGTYGNNERHLSGPTGQAARLDGAASTISLNGTPVTGDWAAEFVLRKDQALEVGSLLRDNDTALRLDQFQNTNEIGFTEFGRADFRFSPAAVAELGEWIHLVFNADSVNGRTDLYINGVLVGSNDNFVTLPRGSIGSSDTAAATLDEVALYDRMLTDQEIADHFAAAGIPEPGAAALFCVAAAALARRRRTSGSV